VTAYRIWKSEHDKVVERDQRKRQLLDEISTLREARVQYRIDMEADHLARRYNFDQVRQQKYDNLEDQIATKIKQTVIEGRGHHLPQAREYTAHRRPDHGRVSLAGPDRHLCL